MAGTLTISTLSDGTNSTSSTNCIQGSAKAWANWNGNGVGTIRASYNVSSVTYLQTGYYKVNFTNAFSDTNYAVTGCASDDAVAATLVCTSGTWTQNQTTTWATIFVGNTGAGYNRTMVSVAVFR